jgi:hypothetical protein
VPEVPLLVCVDDRDRPLSRLLREAAVRAKTASLTPEYPNYRRSDRGCGGYDAAPRTNEERNMLMKEPWLRWHTIATYSEGPSPPGPPECRAR